ncbi:MAG TPA: SGNH/GDSL hydrolase family protein, partial [Longimicrobium sp.]|nr:SGNH/GDSL hydrolase family protein [Longimicrobium sp.]
SPPPSPARIHMPHVVLLGDSIFDNAAYVRGGPDVLAHLRDRLPDGWSATLAAIDGATTEDMHIQYGRIPPDATHLVLSIGGNDALMNIDILERRVTSSGEVLAMLADVRDAFGDRYGEILRALRARGLPLTVCTIYEGSFPGARMHRLAKTALTVFNDMILRCAIRAGLPVIDLRLVCSDPADYANPIEPSVQGGARIAHAIALAVDAEGDGRPRTQVITL